MIATDGVVTLRAPEPGHVELHRLGFVQDGEVDGEPFFTRSLG